MTVHHFGTSRGTEESSFRLHRAPHEDPASVPARLTDGPDGAEPATPHSPGAQVSHRQKRLRKLNRTTILGLVVMLGSVAAVLCLWLVLEQVTAAQRGMPTTASRSPRGGVAAGSASAGVGVTPSTEAGGRDDTAAQRRGGGRGLRPAAPREGKDVPLVDDTVIRLGRTPAAVAHRMFVAAKPVRARGRIDELVLQRLAELKIAPARPCSDEVFLRRVYLDVIGTLPTPDQAREFLDDRSPEKRARLIDELLERPEFADYWGMKWCDLLRVKAEFPIKLWPNAAQAYHRWIRTALQTGMPYDRFASELLTASGSNFRLPQVNFYRAVQSREPAALAQAVALTFLGERTEHWPEERLQGFSTFFTRVGYKPTGEWKEEIVYFDSRQSTEDSGAEAVSAILPDGTTVEIPRGEDPRRVFAAWLTGEGRRGLARAVANRAWCWLHGRGIVHPPDDIRPDNPPAQPALLEHLASELIAAEFDLRQLYRVILNSQVYQLSSIPESSDPRAAENFAFYPTRRVDAEVLIDAICQITGTTESYSSIIPEPFTFLPDHQRAIALPDGSITSSFLEMFGRPARDTGLESERNNQLTASQALHLLNSNHLRQKLKDGPGLRNLLSQTDGAEELYLAILSRRPTEREFAAVYDLCVYGGGKDVAWALINSDEFLFRH